LFRRAPSYGFAALATAALPALSPIGLLTAISLRPGVGCSCSEQERNGAKDVPFLAVVALEQGLMIGKGLGKASDACACSSLGGSRRTS
jgi:hypothetical protein